MSTLRQGLARLVFFFRKRELDRDFDEELASHIELATQDHLRQGMSLAEARRIAVLKLGGVEPTKEMHRDWRGLPWLDGILQDLRHAVRSLLRSPGFTLTAVATLALGIGVNAAVFTVVNAVLFKGFPLVPRNDRLAYISGGGCCVSYPDFEDYRAGAKSFEGMAIVHGTRFILTDGGGFPESINATEVSSETFKVVHVRPALGRDFEPSDEIPGSARVAILSYDFWKSRYGLDAGVLGRTVRMNGAATTLIGVMPPGFSFPQKLDMWVPLEKTREVLQRQNRDTWFVFGRLAKGATLDGARAEIETIGKRLAKEYPLSNQQYRPLVQSFSGFFIGPHATLIYGSMWGAVGFVLLIACANLANLLLARAMGRLREISLRVALGAGRWRITRQLLIESLLLSSAGGCFGWWLAKWGVRGYALAMAQKSSWLIVDYTMDVRVLGYLAGISMGTGILFGLAPALRLARLDVSSALKEGGRGSISGRSGKHLSRLLVAGEIALAVVLLAGAGVMIRSFLKIHNADIGVRAENVYTALLDLPKDRYPQPEARLAFFERLKAGLARIPGVESVAMADALPASNAARHAIEIAGAPEMEQRQRVPLLTVSNNYFRTLGAALLAGREFRDTDRYPVVLVNERFASKHWPGENPEGKQVRFADGTKPGPWLTVIGVVSNILQNEPNGQEFQPVIYQPYQINAGGGMWVFLRSRISGDTLGDAFRRELRAVDSDLPVYGPLPLAGRLEMFSDTGFYGTLFLILSAIALLLASIGIYSVIANGVRQRTGEIGIRVAIGATGGDILRLIMVQGALPVGWGLLIGLPAALAVNRMLQSFLVQVSPFDPVTLAGASGVLVMGAALGCWIPARRAMRVDPVVALRSE